MAIISYDALRLLVRWLYATSSRCNVLSLPIDASASAADELLDSFLASHRRMVYGKLRVTIVPDARRYLRTYGDPVTLSNAFTDEDLPQPAWLIRRLPLSHLPQFLTSKYDTVKVAALKSVERYRKRGIILSPIRLSTLI